MKQGQGGKDVLSFNVSGEKQYETIYAGQRPVGFLLWAGAALSPGSILQTVSWKTGREGCLPARRNREICILLSSEKVKTFY